MEIKAYKRRYSGKLSAEFWRRVNAIPKNQGGMTLYIMGCALQDLEIRTLQALDDLEQRKPLRIHKKQK
jgi:hypothetical protein